MDEASGTGSTNHGWEPIPLYYDAVFRWVFGSEQHKHVLGKFLKAAMPDVPAEEWASLTLPNTHVLRPGQKEVVLDVLAITAQRRIAVEMQMRWDDGIRQRFTFSNSTQVVDQLNPGDSYLELLPVVTLVVCGFVLIWEDRTYKHTFTDYDQENKVRFTSLRELRTLELPKLHDDDGSELWDWMRLIAAPTKEEIDMVVAGNPDLREAADLVKEFSADEARRYAARAHEKFLHDQATREDCARRRGLAQGREEGRQEGRQEGRREAIQRLAAQGMPVAQVADIFAMASDEVEAIINAR